MEKEKTLPGVLFRAERNAEAGLFLGLAITLNLLKIFQLPTGGTVALSILPLIIFSYRRGFFAGLALSFIFGVSNFILNPMLINAQSPLYAGSQVLLDYLLPSMAAPFFIFYGKKLWQLSLGLMTCFLIKYICHVLSGAIFFSSYAPKEWNPWTYSLIYNASYTLPEFFLVGIVFFGIYKRYPWILSGDNILNASNF